MDLFPIAFILNPFRFKILKVEEIQTLQVLKFPYGESKIQ